MARRDVARRSEVEPSEPSERASEGEAGQGSHISALVRTRAPAETSQGENLFDSPLRALIHWRIPYLATCSLFLPRLFLPFTLLCTPISHFLSVFLSFFDQFFNPIQTGPRAYA